MRSHFFLISAVGLASPAPQYSRSVEFSPGDNEACKCNGHLDSENQGECNQWSSERQQQANALAFLCRSPHCNVPQLSKVHREEKPFCYVDPGTCLDGVESSTEGRWRSTSQGAEWSYYHRSESACEKSRSVEFSPSDDSQVNFPSEEDDRGNYCWCESELAPFQSHHQSFLVDTRRGYQHVVNLPQCGAGERLVCRREHGNGAPTRRPPLPTLPTTSTTTTTTTPRPNLPTLPPSPPTLPTPSQSPPTLPSRDPAVEDREPLVKTTCSCNGQLNNAQRGLKACESKHQGYKWCYVEPGSCSDETISTKTGKTWSHHACLVETSP